MTVFWIIIVAIAASVAALLARAMVRVSATAVPDAIAFDLQVYRDQLAEVDRDVARGVLPAEDAERARTEISRRILALDSQRRTAPDASGRPSPWLMGGIALSLLGGSTALYLWQGAPGYGDLALQDRITFAAEMRESRPSQAAAVAGLPPFEAGDTLPEDFAQLLDRLRTAVATRPDDLEGHVLLAQNEARIGNFTAAVRAQDAVLRIKADSVSATDIADLGELLVLAAGGYVSPEAENAFRAALNRDPADGRARYYLGLMMIQTGRPDIGFRLWDALLRRGPPEAPWIAPITSQIPTVAQLAGVNYTLPEIGAGAAPGPSTEDIEAAAEMSPEARMKMIGGMVSGLSNRLATEGGPPRDWARLITSLAIMGNPAQARAVFDNAMDVFAGDPAAIDILRDAGQQAGVSE
ncbi:MAG: c-type cytochrome biogenesis protein CcmI [Pseudomonadota bacterium]